MRRCVVPVCCAVALFAVTGCADTDDGAGVDRPPATADASRDATTNSTRGATAETVPAERAATTDSQPTATGNSTNSASTNPVTALVVEKRPPTDAERDRLDDDGRGGLLDCPDD